MGFFCQEGGLPIYAKTSSAMVGLQVHVNPLGIKYRERKAASLLFQGPVLLIQHSLHFVFAGASLYSTLGHLVPALNKFEHRRSLVRQVVGLATGFAIGAWAVV